VIGPLLISEPGKATQYAGGERQVVAEVRRTAM
jgi:hypothetical protein